MSTESFDISLPTELLRQLDNEATANNMSRNEYIAQTLQNQLGPVTANNTKTNNLHDKNDTLPALVKLFCDGGSRGNPGPAAGGFVILDMQDNVLRESGKFLGVATNNYAEYHSLKGGLEMCLAQGAKHVDVYMDSLLVINQMKGSYKVKHESLIPIFMAIKQLVPHFSKVTFTHVPRELNKLADAEVNKALDAL